MKSDPWFDEIEGRVPRHLLHREYTSEYKSVRRAIDEILPGQWLRIYQSDFVKAFTIIRTPEDQLFGPERSAFEEFDDEYGHLFTAELDLYGMSRGPWIMVQSKLRIEVRRIMPRWRPSYSELWCDVEDPEACYREIRVQDPITVPVVLLGEKFLCELDEWNRKMPMLERDLKAEYIRDRQIKKGIPYDGEY